MVGEKFAATVRVKRGMRWLDENFPGWMSRIDIETLYMNDGVGCICGQVFHEQANTFGVSGYEYATNHLFSQANGWITVLTKVQPVDDDDGWRSERVSVLLGFNCGNVEETFNLTDRTFVSFDQLQETWEAQLQKRMEKVNG